MYYSLFIAIRCFNIKIVNIFCIISHMLYWFKSYAIISHNMAHSYTYFTPLWFITILSKLVEIIIQNHLISDNKLMRRMATDVVEFFNVGTTVSCKTCLGKEVEGEVLAFDSATRMLILKSDATSSRSRVGQKIFRNGKVERRPY